ncbi:MAG: SDR family oxidoreductase [Xanthomonadales bacterium]|nr:SDR family oxidoreductase [Xanthomonadales bacterium]
MNINWEQQTVVLTGAYGGLGRELAQLIHQKGAKLILFGRNEQRLLDLQHQLGANVDVFVGDVSDAENNQLLMQSLQNEASPQRMLINNAAISQTGFLQNQSATEIKRVLDVNLLSPILLSQQLLPWLKHAKSAQIINIGSSFGAIGYPGFSSYCASKFGLRGFTQALGRELSDTVVRTQYLAPRAMATGINSAAVDDLNQQLKNTVDEPAQVAQQILKAIEKNQSEKFFGWPEKLFTKINALLPNVVSKAIRKDQSTIKSFLNNEVKS